MNLTRAGLLVALPLVVPSPFVEAAGQKPYKKTGDAPLEYRGPGREIPEPEVDEVALGWFGPGDPDDPAGGDHWRGAVLALEELNEAGGDQGRPFRLVSAWSANPWGTGIVQVTRLVFQQGVWAILGAIDGATAHLAEQVALKARVTLVSSGSTDKTAHMASVPWMFSCLPSDEVQAPVLVEALAAAAPAGPFAIAAAAEHDAHAALIELRRVLSARRLTPASLLEFDPGKADLEPLAERVLEGRPRAVIVLAPAQAAARLVKALRGRGFVGAVIGGPTLARRAFVRAAGDAAEGVVVPLLWEPSPRWTRFARMYENRWGEPPDHVAAWSYDAVHLVADAVRRAGLNRARIRDAVRELSPRPGVAGTLRWDPLGRNEAPVGLAVWKNGRLHPILVPRGE